MIIEYNKNEKLGETLWFSIFIEVAIIHKSILIFRAAKVQKISKIMESIISTKL